MSDKGKKVPLVIYVDGERQVIGEATILNGKISATITEKAGESFRFHLDRRFDFISNGPFSLDAPAKETFSEGEISLINPDYSEKGLPPRWQRRNKSVKPLLPNERHTWLRRKKTK